MNQAALKQAITAILDMELNNYHMTRAVQQLEKELQREFVMPGRNSVAAPIPPKNPRGRTSISDIILTLAACVILGTIVDFVVNVVGILFFDKAASSFSRYLTDIGRYAAIFAALVISIGIIDCIKGKADYKKRCKVYKKELERYERDREILSQEREALMKADHARKLVLKQQQAQLYHKLQESNIVLARLYNTVGLDEKFRNIVPVAYMYEFIRLGISTRLGGADGLYYLTMKELRMDQMQYKLDTIISRLDSIIDRNHSLYGMLMNINSKCDNMIESSLKNVDAVLAQNRLIDQQNAVLKQVSANTAIAAYNSERIAREQEYQSFMTRYQSW